MKKLTLSIKDRVQLMGILQTTEGRRMEAITLRSILTLVTFTAQEISKAGLKDAANDSVTWNPLGAFDAEYELTDEQVFMLKKCMDVFDHNGKMTIDFLPLDTKITVL